MGKMETDIARDDIAHAFILEDADFDDDGAEAASHLAEGRPIYFTARTTPNGLIVRQSPDGRRDMMAMDPEGSLRVVGPA
jgi:hypothetical protein